MVWASRKKLLLTCTLALATVTAQAAVLKEIERTVVNKKIINGEVVEEPSLQTRATPTGPETIQTNTTANVFPPCEDLFDNPDGCSALAEATAIASFLIEPESGEQEGDPILYCAVWNGRAAASADSGAAAAAASGSQPTSGSTIPPNTATAEVAAAYVRVNAGPFLEFDEIEVDAPLSDSDQLTMSKQLDVVIGDTIEFSAASISAAATPLGNFSASASAESEVIITQGPCAVAAVPTTNQWGLAIAVIFLAVIGFFGLRRTAA